MSGIVTTIDSFGSERILRCGDCGVICRWGWLLDNTRHKSTCVFNVDYVAGRAHYGYIPAEKI